MADAAESLIQHRTLIIKLISNSAPYVLLRYYSAIAQQQFWCRVLRLRCEICAEQRSMSSSIRPKPAKTNLSRRWLYAQSDARWIMRKSIKTRRSLRALSSKSVKVLEASSARPSARNVRSTVKHSYCVQVHGRRATIRAIQKEKSAMHGDTDSD